MKSNDTSSKTGLVSLRERPATKDDIGTVVYYPNADVYNIEDMEDVKHINDWCNYFYWQKPVIISESEYQDLKMKEDILSDEQATEATRRIDWDNMCFNVAVDRVLAIFNKKLEEFNKEDGLRFEILTDDFVQEAQKIKDESCKIYQKTEKLRSEHQQLKCEISAMKEDMQKRVASYENDIKAFKAENEKLKFYVQCHKDAINVLPRNVALITENKKLRELVEKSKNFLQALTNNPSYTYGEKTEARRLLKDHNTLKGAENEGVGK